MTEASAQIPQQNGQVRDWRSQMFRGRVVEQIAAVMTNGYFLTSRSPAEVEEVIFSKSSSREEYIGLIARLIIHLRETTGIQHDLSRLELRSN